MSKKHAVVAIPKTHDEVEGAGAEPEQSGLPGKKTELSSVSIISEVGAIPKKDPEVSWSHDGIND
jgi:hypothetical protein